MPQAFSIMEEQLGRPLAAVFSSISERPIAAASIGQVRRRRGRDADVDLYGPTRVVGWGGCV